MKNKRIEKIYKPEYHKGLKNLRNRAKSGRGSWQEFRKAKFEAEKYPQTKQETDAK